MKLKVFPRVLVLMFGLLLLSSCQPAAREVVVTPANVNAGKENVDKASIEAALLRIEKDWPRVIKEKDAEAVRRLEADDVILVYPDGGTGGKEQDVKDIERGALTADSMEMTDLKVNVISADAAVVTGRTIVKNGKFKMADGSSVNISGQYRFVDTFAKRNGEWKLVAGASAPVKQPVPEASPTASPAAKASPAGATSPAVKPSPTSKASPAATP